ncbi:MAG: GGDEF domain-containing protein [Treponema sp.]|nr:GGDEF domain-containing protein [Treponema sp.]
MLVMFELKDDAISFIINSSFVGFISFICLTIFISVDKTFPERTNKKFMRALHCAVILLCIDCIDYYVQHTYNDTHVWLIIAAFGYSMRIITMGFLVAITQRNKQRTNRIVYILMGINALFAFLSIKTGWYFNLDENNHWKFGLFNLVPYGIVFFYVLLMLKEAIIQFKTNPGESILIAAVLISCFISNILELKQVFYMVLASNLIISIFFYYICLNVQLYRRDTLTSLLNRRSFYMDLKRNNYQTIIIASLDLNDLKLFNDTEGHKAGDIALITSAQNMEECFKDIGTTYRTGGDEFNVIFKTKDTEIVDTAIHKFQKKMAETRYQVACGYAICYPDDDFEKIISIADEAMYLNKKKIKSNKKMEELKSLKDFKSVVIE